MRQFRETKMIKSPQKLRKNTQSHVPSTVLYLNFEHKIGSSFHLTSLQKRAAYRDNVSRPSFCTVYYVQCTMYNMYSVHCTLYSVLYMLGLTYMPVCQVKFRLCLPRRKIRRFSDKSITENNSFSHLY